MNGREGGSGSHTNLLDAFAVVTLFVGIGLLISAGGLIPHQKATALAAVVLGALLLARGKLAAYLSPFRRADSYWQGRRGMGGEPPCSQDDEAEPSRSNECCPGCGGDVLGIDDICPTCGKLIGLEEDWR